MLSNPQEWESPTKLLAEHPVMFTGTGWKLLMLSSHWQSLQQEKEWRKLKLGEVGEAEQLAVEAIEPNELIEASSLIAGKAKNQTGSLNAALHGGVGKIGEQRVIPKWLMQEIEGRGRAQLVFVSNDVSKREQQGKTWETRRNMMLPKELFTSRNEPKLRQWIMCHWEEQYKEMDEGGMMSVVDSAMAIVQAELFSGGVKLRIATGNSVAGIRYERNLLATEKGRNAYLDYVMEVYGDSSKIKNRHWSPLTELNHRAGGVKMEDLREVCLAVNVKSDILVRGRGDVEKGRYLLEHLEGAPYHLFRAMILMMATSSDREVFHGDELIIEQYPKGQKDVLRVH